MKRSLGNHHQVAHVWASQTQSDGYGSNMLFEGPSIYSYGKHFEIARIVKPGIVLFNSASHSVSTSKHQGRAYSAASHMKVFTVPSMTDHNANAEYLAQTLDNELARITRMRGDRDFWLEQYQKSADKAAEYVKIFGKEIKAPAKKAIAAIYTKRENPLTPEQLAKFKAQTAARREKNKAEKARKEAAEAARKAELQKDYDGWKRGTVPSLSWEATNLFPTALRVRENEIQTSRGASIPVIEAKKFWHALTDTGKVEGMRLGHYTVTSVRNGILTVGCHQIPLREVARMAITLRLDTGTVDGLDKALQQSF